MELLIKIFLGGIILTGIPGIILTIYGSIHKPVLSRETDKTTCSWNCKEDNETGEEVRIENSRFSGFILLGISVTIIIIFGLYVLHMHFYNMDFGISNWRTSNENQQQICSPLAGVATRLSDNTRYDFDTDNGHSTEMLASDSVLNEEAPPSYHSIRETNEGVVPSYEESVSNSHMQTTV